jgi:DNA-binding SARP family transcriptional activator/tetratricopeptide (TPR) repeat protein
VVAGKAPAKPLQRRIAVFSVAAMEFRLLGPLEVVEDNRTIEIGAAKERALLAVLLLNANRAVSRDRLIEALWGERAPGTATKALQVYVSHLRKAIGRDRILTRSPGYELRVEPGQLDLERFDELVASQELEKALGLWRGSPLADFAYEPFAQAEIARLEELHLSCLERRIEAGLSEGRHAAVVAELEALVAEHPLRERLRAQLMLALYRSGRQADALDAYQSGRRTLSAELGLEPGAELRELQRRILAQDPSLDLVVTPAQAEVERPAPDSPPAADLPRPREARKTVTVLSCDVAATKPDLDPESLRRLTAQGFDELLPVLEGHGAVVERSLGGAVSAIFGIPTVHEDDALRAARAAVEMSDRLEARRDELTVQWGSSLELRVGIGTGEVLVVPDSDRPYVTGQPVQSAIRLQQRASPGELLVDERTHVLIRDAADVEARDDHARIVAVRPLVFDAGHRFDSPMVGRARERRRLRDAFEQAVGDRSCQLFTLIGAPGVGKSRLVREFVDDVSDEALVARGRCLPYGEGITYWPILEAVRDVAGLDDIASPAESLAKLATLVEGDEDAEVVAQRLGEVVGLSDRLSGADETFWAVRSFFEALARRRPLVVVFDDIHWGERTFLDLVDHLADWIRDAPVLLLCVARPELLEVEPHWAGGKLNATSMLLQPLTDDESRELTANLAVNVDLDESKQRQIVDAAGGNPLFVEEMVALVTEQDSDTATTIVPPTIQALLAARLDLVAADERAALEAAAVEGMVFHETSVAELVGLQIGDVRERVATLVRRELVRVDRPIFEAERAYRFRHLLIRDVAYDSIPKESRAHLHERHARWLERTAGERALEFEEILGYHLEQAFNYRSELGRVGEAEQRLALSAGRRLGRAGRRALARGDIPAAMNLASRAAALLPSDDPLRVHVVPGVRITQGLGAQLRWADAVLREAAASADPTLQAHARVQEALLRLFTEATVDVEELVSEATDAIATFERTGDELGLARAFRLLQQARYLGRQSAASADAAEQALVYARSAEDALEEVEIVDWLSVALFMGATPVSEGQRRLHHHLEELRGGRVSEAALLGCLAALNAMRGEFETARSLIDRVRPLVDDLAYVSRLSIVPFYAGITELLADDPVSAERVLRTPLEALEAIGETSTYCAIVAVLADAVYRQSRYEEAEQLTRISEEASHLNDVFSNITWLRVRAKTLARQEAFDEAKSLALEALAFAADSDFLNAHGDTLLDLAEVLELAGRPHEAPSTIEQAIVLFEQKENVVSAARARSRLARLTATG